MPSTHDRRPAAPRGRRSGRRSLRSASRHDEARCRRRSPRPRLARRLGGDGRAGHRAPRRGGRRSLVHLPVPAHEADRDEVQDERDHEEREADGEDRLVTRWSRSGCRPSPVARDERGHRLRSPARGSSDGRAGPGRPAIRTIMRLADGARGAEHDARRRCRRAPPGRRRASADLAACSRRARTRPRAGVRHRGHRVLGDRRDRRQDQDADDEARRERVEHGCTSRPRSRSLQDLGREEGEREVAEDDRRDAGEHLEDRLDDLADALRRVLGEVDRRPRPSGIATSIAIAVMIQRAQEERQDAELLVGEQRRPLRAEQELRELTASPKKAIVSPSSEKTITDAW